MPTDQKRWVWIGVDLGQRRDHSAIAVVERVWEQSTFNEFLRTSVDGRWTFRVRLLERIRLDTPHPDVVRRVKQISELPMAAMGRTVVVDGTGGGSTGGGYVEAGGDGVFHCSGVDYGRGEAVDEFGGWV